MKKKRSLTLLEITIVMVLMGFLLTGLFHIFYQTLRKNAENKELKQTILSLELFEQNMKQLLTRTKKIWSAPCPEAKEDALFFQFSSPIDVEWDRVEQLQGMLYLNGDKQLCFVAWSSGGEPRVDLFLDHVESFSCSFFNPLKKDWQAHWPSKIETLPAVLSITLLWKDSRIPLTFFPPNPNEQISYWGVP